jgi:hypothetical protein
MKFNFYISCENADEVQSCVDFIGRMNARRELPEFTPNAAVPIAGKRAPFTGVGTLTDAPKETPKPLENVSPGDPAISKMGAATKEHVLKLLKQGEQPPAAYAEHLKLMWARGEVKYDGTIYYL